MIYFNLPDGEIRELRNSRDTLIAYVIRSLIWAIVFLILFYIFHLKIFLAISIIIFIVILISIIIIIKTIKDIIYIKKYHGGK